MLLHSGNDINIVGDRKKYRNTINTNSNGKGEMSLIYIHMQITLDIISDFEVFMNILCD